MKTSMAGVFNQKSSTFIYIYSEVLFVEFGKFGGRASLGDALIPNCSNTIKYVKKLAIIEVSKNLLTLK